MNLEFNRENILRALDLIDRNPKLTSGRQSIQYDLVHNGKTYPPILVLSEANKLNGGEELTLANFGSTSKAFKILKKLEFEISLKLSNKKSKYLAWGAQNLKIQAGTLQQYVSAIDSLSKIVNYNIFDTTSVDKLKGLYEDLIKNQKNVQSIYYDPKKPSVSLKGWYSASIKTYIDFLNFDLGQNQIDDLLFEIDSFHEALESSKLNFSKKIVDRFVCSILTKPFVLLSGLSGSGKTKLAQAFVYWICEEKTQFKIVPVGSDWTNREPLLGYPNGLDSKEYILPETGFLEVILEAAKSENANKPYFIILDEMNLSHVERYFADFLSIMESDDNIKLYSGAKKQSSNGLIIPSEIEWPGNLFIIGTVNIDETTYMFSPKVLDRANTIEFRVDESDMKSFFKSPSKVDFENLVGKGKNMAKHFVELAADNKPDDKINHTDILIHFFIELKKVGAEFGFRTASEMLLLIRKLKTISNTSTEECIDIAVMQKLLPKLHGSRSKLSETLKSLIKLCVKEGQTLSFDNNQKVNPENILYPLAFEKLNRMYANVKENGFTSYAEA